MGVLTVITNTNVVSNFKAYNYFFCQEAKLFVRKHVMVMEACDLLM